VQLQILGSRDRCCGRGRNLLVLANGVALSARHRIADAEESPHAERRLIGQIGGVQVIAGLGELATRLLNNEVEVIR